MPSSDKQYPNVKESFDNLLLAFSKEDSERFEFLIVISY